MLFWAPFWSIRRPQYYVTAPGAAIDTSRLVTVENGDVHRGHLYLLVVNTQPANLFWYLYAQVDRRAVLETKEQYLGSFESYAEYLDWNRQLMSDSQRTARAVAFQQLGFGEGVRSVGARVVGVLADSPVARHPARGRRHRRPGRRTGDRHRLAAQPPGRDSRGRGGAR